MFEAIGLLLTERIDRGVGLSLAVVLGVCRRLVVEKERELCSNFDFVNFPSVVRLSESKSWRPLTVEYHVIYR